MDEVDVLRRQGIEALEAHSSGLPVSGRETGVAIRLSLAEGEDEGWAGA